MEQGIIRAICTSPEKGTEKKTVQEALLKEDWGMEGDAHAGKWHRQVSLLSLEKIQGRCGVWRFWRKSGGRRSESGGASRGDQAPVRRSPSGTDPAGESLPQSLRHLP